MPREPEPSPAKVVIAMALAVLLGAPMAAFLWEVLHEVLALHPDARHLALALPVLALFATVLALYARRLRHRGAARCQADPEPPSPGGPR